MSATYNLFKNPGKGDNLHARQVNQYTIRIDELCDEISEISAFSSSDVKGMLEALKNRIASHLKYGAIVELEGLGTFNASLKCPPLSSEKQITPHLVKFSKVVFRCSKELKNELRQMKLERANEPSRLKGYTEEKRKANILNYLKQNKTIYTYTCLSINGCSKYIALKDLRTLLTEGKIIRLGYRSNAQYGLQEKEE
ncbi:MAG: HU family DNA-binding protein [Parabacteroides gordonii]|nr:HU family DNA-binding protein [Parabacteroides gordonii]